MESAAEVVHAALARSNGRTELLPGEYRTFLAIHTGQAIIDNGGLQYFFEMDFDGQPNYSIFVDAYSSIGCDRAALLMAEAVAAFPFKDPHLHQRKRQRHLSAHPQSFAAPEKFLCGNADVWRRLAQFAQKHGLHGSEV